MPNFVDGIVGFFRRFFVFHQSILVLILWFGILALSLVKPSIDLPNTFFSSKRNFVNQFFVKWSWGWTLILTGSYGILASFVYGCDYWKKSIFLTTVRLAIGTSIWFFWVNVVFRYIENITGVCVDRHGSPNFNITNKPECVKLKQGHFWNGFDISGHCFLLSFSILTINSEIRIHKNWFKIPTHAAQYLPIGSRTLSNLKLRHNVTLTLINCLFILNCIMIATWFMMIASTCLYFHTFFSKALGASCAIFSWMVTYNEWYKCKFSPRLPGNGPLQGILIKIQSKNN